MVMFRVDFGGDIGLGHLKRSLVYAKNYDKVTYVSKNDMKEFVPYPLYSIKDESEFFALVEKLQPCEVIIDNYNFTLEHEKTFKKSFPDIKLSVFDDDYREHYCDEIINHNISADKNRYKDPSIVKIIPPLIRDEFIEEKDKKREKIYDIFISLGGADATGLNIALLQILPKDKKIALLTTSVNKNLKELREFVKNRENIFLHIDSNEVAKLLNQSKFAIVTPSVIVHEVLYMGTPFVAIKTADNQSDIFEYLRKSGYEVYQNLEEMREKYENSHTYY